MKRTLIAGACYFALVYAAGWVLGPIRVLWIAPQLGPTLASVMEAPFMLAATAAAARFVVRRTAVPPALGQRIAMGLWALGLLTIAETSAALAIRHLALVDYLAEFAKASGLIALLLFLLLLFAAMPALIRHAPRWG